MKSRRWRDSVKAAIVYAKVLCQEGAWLFQETEKKIVLVCLALENKERIIGCSSEMSNKDKE